MAFSSLQAEQAGGTAITLLMGLNTHEHLMARRETAVGTEGPSSQEVVLCSLEREGPCETCAAEPQVKGVSKAVTSLCTLSLENYGCPLHCHQRRQEGQGWRRFCAPVAAPRTIMQE